MARTPSSLARNFKPSPPKRWASSASRVCTSKEVSHEGQGLTAVEKIFNNNAVGTSGNVLHAGSYVRAEVNIVGSQDTTGLMTSQELGDDGRDDHLPL